MAPYKKRPASRARRQRGAALLILVMLAGIGLSALLVSALGRNSLEQRRTQLTLARLSQATEALAGFAATYGRLPRPAASATDGREAAQPCPSEEQCSGYLPWVTLGVDGSDAWGKRLRYSVTPEFTSEPVRRLVAVATKTVQTRYPSGALAYTAGQGSCELAAQCVPLVVLSHGRNNFGTSTLGVAQANTALGNVDELLNAASSAHFIARPATDDPLAAGGAFDDLVATLPLSYLYKQMTRAHRLP